MTTWHLAMSFIKLIEHSYRAFFTLTEPVSCSIDFFPPLYFYLFGDEWPHHCQAAWYWQDDCHRLARGWHVAIGWDLWHRQGSAGATVSHVLVQISRLQCRKGRLPISPSLRHTSERPYYRSIILSPCYGQLPTDPVAAAADEQMKIPSVENPELTNVLFKPGVGQNIAMRAVIAFPVHSLSYFRSKYSHACFAYCREVLISAFPVLSPSYFQSDYNNNNT